MSADQEETNIGATYETEILEVAIIYVIVAS